MARASFNLRDPRQLLAVGLGSGLAGRWGPTAGTALGLPLAWLVGELYIVWQVVVIAVGFGLGCWICGVAARAAGVHDHPAIVWDEIVGILVACVGLSLTPLTLLAAFVLFRVFDVRKPWPIRWVDRHMSGGFGIMIDDVMAGVLAAVVLQILVAFGAL